MIHFQDVSVAWEEKTLVCDVSLLVPHGKKGVIVGPSGCGKSTLLMAVMGAIRLRSGSIHIDSIEVTPGNLASVRAVAAHIGQEPELCEMDVRSAIKLPFTFRANRHQHPSEDEILRTLDLLNLPASILDQMSVKVSGGEKRRLAIVRALLLGKSIFLLDEILTGMDDANQQVIMDLFISREDITVLSVSHNPRWIERCDTVVTIAHGTVTQTDGEGG